MKKTILPPRTGVWAVFSLLLVLAAAGSALAEEAIVAPVIAPEPAEPAPVSTLDTGDTSWVLISSALVMLMTPGLAFFYGGLVRRKANKI